MRSKECGQNECSKPRGRGEYCSPVCRALANLGVARSQYLDIVATAQSWADVERAIDPERLVSPHTTYMRIRVLRRNITCDTTHFTGRGWHKGFPSARKKTLADVLDDPNAHTGMLKRLLIEEGVKEAKCERDGCGLSEWFGVSATLELDHIDGNKRNNALKNLKILCLQCHAQTPTWRRRKSAIKHV